MINALLTLSIEIKETVGIVRLYVHVMMSSIIR